MVYVETDGMVVSLLAAFLRDAHSAAPGTVIANDARPPPPRTNRTRRVLHPVLIGHAAVGPFASRRGDHGEHCRTNWGAERAVTGARRREEGRDASG